MKIPKGFLIDPDRNTLYGTFAVAISMFVFAYSSNFGKLPILVYYALWLPLIAVDYRKVCGNVARYYWILPFGVLACLSMFWSQAPGATARTAIQYATQIVCALIAARTINIKTLSCGVLIGVTIVIIYSLLKGSYQYDPFDGGYSFAGAFSSKNQLGFFCAIGIYFSFATFFILRLRRAILPIILLAAALSLYGLRISHSATAVITLAATLALMIGLGAVSFFRAATRKSMFVAGAVLGLGLLAAFFTLGGYSALLEAFGKNTTLTGRTYLWSQGLLVATKTPLLGVGYQAFWVQGFADAERLWHEYYITARTGFHFHNTYIEVLVETGWVGVILLTLLLLRTEGSLLARLLNDNADSTAHILFGLMTMLLMRSFVEVDVINPYVIGSFFLFYAAGITTLAPTRARASYATFQVQLSQ
jgi:exopolysaccharide production protein ExoQ